MLNIIARSYYHFWNLTRVDPPVVMNNPVIAGIHGDRLVSGEASTMLGVESWGSKVCMGRTQSNI
jgi:hypothetical protein